MILLLFPCNLEGWIIDDNNKPDKEVGNQPGHIRLGYEFRAVRPGTLIVVASRKDEPVEIQSFPAYIYTNDKIITFGQGLIGIDNCPDYDTESKTPFKNPSYDCQSTFSYRDFKDYAALDNNHDAIQVRNKEGELVHALYWTDSYEEANSPKTIDIRSLIKNTGSSAFSVNGFVVDFTGKDDWFSLSNFREIGRAHV